LVASVIEGLGYKVDKQVGSAGFKIDLAVRDREKPGRYMLAIECDGATYHRALWARERDRLRQEVLENMRWRFHRIWSTDWFYRRGEAVKRLEDALEEAEAIAPGSARPAQALVPEPTPGASGPAPGLPASRPQIPPYRLATCATPRNIEPHQVAVGEMAHITKVIVEMEGPIHQDEVARRVTSLFGRARTGSLISAAALRSLQFLESSSQVIAEGAFWMTPAQLENPPVRDRSSAPISLQQAEMLSPAEIRAAAAIAVRENGILSEEEMAQAVTRLLGFRRTGADLRAAVANAIGKSQGIV